MIRRCEGKHFRLCFTPVDFKAQLRGIFHAMNSEAGVAYGYPHHTMPNRQEQMQMEKENLNQQCHPLVVPALVHLVAKESWRVISLQAHTSKVLTHIEFQALCDSMRELTVGIQAVRRPKECCLWMNILITANLSAVSMRHESFASGATSRLL